MVSTATSRDLFQFDLDICGGRGEVAGADEAGRGCLAGPIVAAAVVFDYSGGTDIFENLAGRLNDSKKLSARAREELYPLIVGSAARLAIVVAGNRTIDEKGLHKTNLRALEASLMSLSPCPRHAIVDGYEISDSPVPHEAVKKGDSRSAVIAAASVIAKVVRDRIMHTISRDYPLYGFDRHVGYATMAHREAIARHGLCRLHRRSFRTGPLPDVSPSINPGVVKGGDSNK